LAGNLGIHGRGCRSAVTLTYCVYTADLRRITAELPAGRAEVPFFSGSLSAYGGRPKLTARLADLGGVPIPMTTGEFAKLIADETQKWAKVIRAGNIKPE
jgi:hypothetical protein